MRYGGYALIAGFLLCGLGCVFHASLLSALASAWVVDDPVAKADAIVVLGGRPDLRAPEAARLYHQGAAPKVLYMDVKAGATVAMGVIPSEREQTRRMLLSNQVPEMALEAIGKSVGSTYDESCAAHAWAESNHAHAIIIATDISHTRRARWIFRKRLNDLPVKVQVHAVQPREYGVTNWWRNEEGLIAFQNEAIKSLYYWVKY